MKPLTFQGYGLRSVISGLQYTMVEAEARNLSWANTFARSPNRDGEASMDEDEGDDDLAVLAIALPEHCCLGSSWAKLGPSELDWIGRELREYYDIVLREPVSDRLLALLNRGLARRTFH
jgi:hypothetical protein